MGPVDRQPNLCLDFTIRRQTVQERAVDGIDRPVRVGQNGAAPDVVPAREFPGKCRGGERVRIDPLHPPVGRRSTEGCHRPAQVPLPWITLNGHHVPAAGVSEKHLRPARSSVESPRPGLLAAISTTFHGPGGFPVARMLLSAVRFRHPDHDIQSDESLPETTRDSRKTRPKQLRAR